MSPAQTTSPEKTENRKRRREWLLILLVIVLVVVFSNFETQLLEISSSLPISNTILVLALINVESNFDRFAISYAGARGLMQIMPFWLDEIGRPDDNLFHIKTNLRFGCTILRHYLDRERGDLTKALARYNGSVGRRVYPDKVMNRLSGRWYQR